MSNPTEIGTTRGSRRMLVGAVLALTVVVAAGCSSSDKKSEGKEHIKRAAATKPLSSSTTTAPAPTTTAPPAAPAAPECTVAAAQAAAGPGVTVEAGVACANGYMAGAETDNASGVASGFMLKAVDGHWQQVTGQALTDVCKTLSTASPLYGGCMDN